MPKAPEKTEHHQLPKSMMGSNNAENLILLPSDLHVRWHQWTGNHTPTDVARLMILMSIGREDWCLNPELLDWFLRRSLKPNLSSLYKPEAIIDTSGYDGTTRTVARARHTIDHLIMEGDIVTSLRKSINKGAPLPSTIFPQFVNAFLNFFDTGKPLEAFERLHCHRHGNELAWVKPIQDEVREDILKRFFIDQRDPRVRLSDRKQRLQGILARHESQLKKQERQWRERFGTVVREEPEIEIPSVIWQMPGAFKEAVNSEV